MHSRTGLLYTDIMGGIIQAVQIRKYTAFTSDTVVDKNALNVVASNTIADVVGGGVAVAFQRQQANSFVLTGSVVLHNLLKVTHGAFQGPRFP